MTKKAHTIQEATRYSPNSESFLPDHILTYYEDDVTNLDYTPPLGKRSHAVLTLDFHIIIKNEHASA